MPNAQPSQPDAAVPSPPRDLRRIAERTRHNPRGKSFPPGNPGRVPGSRNKVVALIERVLAEESEELLRAVIARAKAGNPTALRFCARHLPTRSRTAAFDLPAIETSHDAVAAMRHVSALIASGDLEPAQGVALTKVLDRQFGMLHSEELIARSEARHAQRPLAPLSDSDLLTLLRTKRKAERRPQRAAAATSKSPPPRTVTTKPAVHIPHSISEPRTEPATPPPLPASPPPLLELPPSWLQTGDGLARAARMLGLDDLHEGDVTVMPNPQLVAPRLTRPAAGRCGDALLPPGGGNPPPQPSPASRGDARQARAARLRREGGGSRPAADALCVTFPGQPC